MNALAKTPLSHFLSDENGYRNLLEMLLTSATPLAQQFREEFSGLLPEAYRADFRSGPVRVEAEVPVLAVRGRQQTIDLVAFLPRDVVGIELKVHAGSARDGQLLEQYQVLRSQIPGHVRVHSLYVFPGKTKEHEKVQPRAAGDTAWSVDWGEVVEKCLPRTTVAQSDHDLICAIAQAARDGYSKLNAADRKRIFMTPERDVVFGALKSAAQRFDELLAGEAKWRSNWGRYRCQDVFFGPLARQDGSVTSGPRLEVCAIHGLTDHERESVPLKVAFTIGKRAAQAMPGDIEKAMKACACLLPATAGQRDLGPGALVYDVLSVTVQQGQALIGERPAAEVVAQLLHSYAQAFRDYLLR